MWLRTNLRYLIALILALATLLLASEAWAHGNHHHLRTAGTERHISASTPGFKIEASSAFENRLAGQEKCGGAACCGSVCLSCCSVLVQEIVVQAPQLSMMRLELSNGVPQAGLGAERIRRPPKS